MSQYRNLIILLLGASFAWHVEATEVANVQGKPFSAQQFKKELKKVDVEFGACPY